MKEIKTVETTAITEREVVWTPKGYGWPSHQVAIIQDGKLYQFPQIAGYLVEADLDGCIEFIQAIKKAMAETRKD